MSNYGFNTAVARFVTRPGSGELEKYKKEEEINVTPDLIMGTLMRSGAHYLKADTVYELVMNELTGVLELHEKGRSVIGKQWARAYYDIAIEHGSHTWLTRDELEEVRGQ